MNAFTLAAVCIAGYMCLLFVIATATKDNTWADIGWGLGFVLVTWVTYATFGDNRLHQKLIVFLASLWGLRLTMYIGIRHWGQPEDFRYAQWRKEWGRQAVWRSFWQVFMLQGLVMFVVSLPLLIICSTGKFNHSYKWIYPVFTVIGMFGFYFETVSDWQMFNFKNNPHPHGPVMDKGLWKYSRHPNYFGEAVQWWCFFALSIPSGMWYFAILSPLTITYLLLKVSGVTLLEKKYEGNTLYDDYKRRTNAFIPWFPRKAVTLAPPINKSA